MSDSLLLRSMPHTATILHPLFLRRANFAMFAVEKNRCNRSVVAGQRVVGANSTAGTADVSYRIFAYVSDAPSMHMRNTHCRIQFLRRAHMLPTNASRRACADVRIFIRMFAT